MSKLDPRHSIDSFKCKLNVNHADLSFEFTMHVFIQVWKEENLFLDVVHRPLMASQVAEATL